MSYRYGKAKIEGFIKNVWSKEVRIETALAAGSGGQHVNKNETKVQLYWHVTESAIIPKEYIQKIVEQNETIITDEGVLRIDTAVHKSQKANKEQTYKKLAKIIKGAFKEKAVRKKTKPPLWAVDKRIAEKKRRSKIRNKRNRIV